MHMNMVDSFRRENAMPICEYVRQECGERFDTIVSAPAFVECPSCRSTRLAKLVWPFQHGFTDRKRERARSVAESNGIGRAEQPPEILARLRRRARLSAVGIARVLHTEPVAQVVAAREKVGE